MSEGNEKRSLLGRLFGRGAAKSTPEPTPASDALADIARPQPAPVDDTAATELIDDIAPTHT